MERGGWTSERLDDLTERTRSGFARVDQNFARVDQDIRDVRNEMQGGFTGLRSEMNQGFSELRTSIQRTHLTLIVGLIGVLATILARGA